MIKLFLDTARRLTFLSLQCGLNWERFCVQKALSIENIITIVFASICILILKPRTLEMDYEIFKLVAGKGIEMKKV